MCHFLPVYHLGIAFLGRVEGQNITRTSGDHPDYKNIRINKNIEKSHGDIRGLLSLKLQKKHKLTQMWETLNEIKKKKNFKRETESLLMVAQNSAIRTNHIKAMIDKTQQNSKCRLCSDRDETINHIISECSKLAQKECKARHDWVGKVIHREMCKKFKFDHANKWYMHNPAPVLENNTH